MSLTETKNRRELVCIRCPIGCMITVTEETDGSLQVSGNTCPRGDEYARREVSNPTRTVTSTVRVKNAQQKVVSVKTREDIPKGKIMDCMNALKKVALDAPVRIGDIALHDVAGTGVDVIVTKDVEALDEGKEQRDRNE